MEQFVLPMSLRVSAFLLSKLGLALPGVTARLFLSMYSRPPKRKLRESQLAVGRLAASTQMTFSRYPFDERAITVQIYRWGQSDKKVLLLHGWGGSPFDFKQMITTLVNAGYEVISWDAPAHGASAGKETNIVQWMHTLEQLLARIGPVHAIIGHSLGGLSAALALVHKKLQVPRLVMISAAVSAPEFFQQTFQQFGIPNKVMPKVHQLVVKRLQFDLLQLDLFKHIDKINAKNILVIYDENDGVVKKEQIVNFLNQSTAIQSFCIKGEGHYRIMRNDEVLKKVVNFMNID
ncbi:hypothetical protein A4H97_33070 [Niastella yeongjuensis]|uniref:Serine aminopeptidase S33 domain-containing protein n=1 Tax=Niastella yeongjuensis TaxID=354355 RepID=A0A1V9EFV7_9BACT|nr:alpha/beta hydrolase [Niastella yeongjuensis]OQP44996.1 hypothetical protein A4H97_33070 [Niastella yeongjuensis]SEP49142.1 Alpha/beta hydrolase family protein [Niastella yeongjuensis]